MSNAGILLAFHAADPYITRPMADPKAALKKKVEDLKAKVAKEHAAGKDSKKDLAFRSLRKELKRAQRRLALVTPLSHEQKAAPVSQLTDLLSKRAGGLTQAVTKVHA